MDDSEIMVVFDRIAEKMVNSEATAGVVENLSKLIDEIQESNEHRESIIYSLGQITEAIHALAAVLDAK